MGDELPLPALASQYDGSLGIKESKKWIGRRDTRISRGPFDVVVHSLRMGSKSSSIVLDSPFKVLGIKRGGPLGSFFHFIGWAGERGSIEAEVVNERERLKQHFYTA